MTRRGRLTRREFVSGRLWRASERKRPDGGQDTADSATEITSSSRRPLVMRYPKSAADLSVSISDPDARCASRAPGTVRGMIPVHRPPGAVQESKFLAGCTRCNECVRACPHHAIVHAPERMREAAGTPIILADHQPCLMCADYPCIAACQPGVLTDSVPQVMGTARIISQTCLAHHGTTCTVCVERCPVPGAIELAAGKPRINEQICTGCGVCRYVCPAPQNAVLLMPAFSRPTNDTSQEV